jgi:hypothetical protein
MPEVVATSKDANATAVGTLPAVRRRASFQPFQGLVSQRLYDWNGVVAGW